MENQSQSTALYTVRAVLPVFRDLSELWNAGVCAEQQLVAQQTCRAARQDERGRTLGGFLGILVAASANLGLVALKPATPAAVAVMLLGILAGILVGRKVHKRIAAKGQETTPEDQTLIRRLDDLSAEFSAITQRNQALIDAIPRDYRNYEAVRFFEQALSNGRAESMKEAMNLYEEHLHRMTMEHNSNLVLQQQYEQSRMIAAAQQSARDASVSAGIAASFSILAFLSRD